ncbi:unnamed protein product [Polarella glacialis]|uniref:Uncharacterized protein n=1 Tax=Polarella glacialis TaxID=89957 RepID=A0A813G1X0_POLGL|nr:unnamed protein product [Polarella glacialis]CAE8719288.1 unnamed protein product [Polarella glacialis]
MPTMVLQSDCSSEDDEAEVPLCSDVRLSIEWNGSEKLSQHMLRVYTQGRGFHDSHRKFFASLSLAFSAAMWVTMIGSPAYSKAVHAEVFGQRGRLFQHQVWEETVSCVNSTLGPVRCSGVVKKAKLLDDGFSCPGSSFGKMLQIAPDGQTPVIVSWNEALGPWQKPQALWCGYINAKFERYLPNMAQTVVLIVFASTGDTVRLAWQAFTGTVAACTNVFVMQIVYPSGARGCSQAQQNEIGECDKTVYDHGYNEIVCLIDVLLVLFLFLASGAEATTLKFGLMWHLWFMMDFMNPNTEVHLWETSFFGFQVQLQDDIPLVFFTTLFGALIAILATLVPLVFLCQPPLLNRHYILKDGPVIANAIGEIWGESIEYLCGNQRTSRRFQIMHKIDLMSSVISEAKLHVRYAWWETLNLGQDERTRLMMAEVISSASKVHEIMKVLSTSLQQEDFAGNHTKFFRFMRSYVCEVHVLANELMTECAMLAADGDVSDEDRGWIVERVLLLRKSQETLVSAYRQALPEGLTTDLGEELTFVFALSFWASTVDQFATHISDDHRFSRASYASILQKGFRNVWGLQKFTDTDHLTFVFRNMLPIFICFLIGVYAKDWSVFKRYDVTMASTLALLITRFSGTAIHRNLERLLGVMLGKFLPLLICSFLHLMPFAFAFRSEVHALAIFLFIWLTTYVYFSTKSFNYIALLIVGFGVFPLMQPFNPFGNQESTYLTRYRELGQIIVALVIQFVVEGSLHRHSPSQLTTIKIRETADALLRSYASCCEGDLLNLQSQTKHASKALEEARQLALASDPRNEISPGLKAPFKIQLCLSAFSIMSELLAELSIISAAFTDFDRLGEPVVTWSRLESSSTMEQFRQFSANPLMKQFCETMAAGMEACFDVLVLTLQHRTESKIEDDRMERLEKASRNREARDLQFRDSLYASVFATSGSAPEHALRCVVALRALDNSVGLITKLEENIIKENVHL